MASTRNRNTQIDYKLEQQKTQYSQEHKHYLHASNGRPITECIPTVGYIPSHMSKDALSNNPVDIESSLLGIGSTNLVSPCEPVYPSLKKLDFKDFFDRPNAVIMPYPLVYNNNQRPFPV
tara:strand:+ start:560 stop:919 length:360 start_codon:yes stop_codon:yes gene_type:complete